MDSDDETYEFYSDDEFGEDYKKDEQYNNETSEIVCDFLMDYTRDLKLPLGEFLNFKNVNFFLSFYTHN